MINKYDDGKFCQMGKCFGSERHMHSLGDEEYAPRLGIIKEKLDCVVVRWR